MSSIDNAYKFYAEHIYDEDKFTLIKTYKLKLAGSVSSVHWELMGAILTERAGTGGTGADLQGWEVKSAGDKGSYEYQYHLNTGQEKLKEDCVVNHLYFSYSDGYKNVVVRAVAGQNLVKEYFDVWKPEYIKNYDSSVPSKKRRQRFRKAISFSYVQENGILIMKIKDRKLIHRDDTALQYFNER